MGNKNEESLTGGWSENTKETRKGSFNPTSEDLDEAMREFLNKGGKIEKTVPNWDEYYANAVIMQSTITGATDSFLMGV